MRWQDAAQWAEPLLRCGELAGADPALRLGPLKEGAGMAYCLVRADTRGRPALEGFQVDQREPVWRRYGGLSPLPRAAGFRSIEAPVREQPDSQAWRWPPQAPRVTRLLLLYPVGRIHLLLPPVRPPPPPPDTLHSRRHAQMAPCLRRIPRINPTLLNAVPSPVLEGRLGWGFMVHGVVWETRRRNYAKVLAWGRNEGGLH